MNQSSRAPLFRLVVLAAIGLVLGCHGRRSVSKQEPGAASAPRPSAEAPPMAPQTGPAEAARAGFLAVVAAKKDLAAKCWTPLVAKQPSPPRSRHVLREIFSPDGTEQLRDVLDLPGESRPDVAACLRSLPLELKVHASDIPTNVQVTIAFP